jgi:hypothetical protein
LLCQIIRGQMGTTLFQLSLTFEILPAQNPNSFFFNDTNLPSPLPITI